MERSFFPVVLLLLAATIAQAQVQEQPRLFEVRPIQESKGLDTPHGEIVDIPQYQLLLPLPRIETPDGAITREYREELQRVRNENAKRLKLLRDQLERSKERLERFKKELERSRKYKIRFPSNQPIHVA